MSSTEENKRMAGFCIEQMFKGSTFYITDIDKAQRLIGCEHRGGAYDKLHVLHCVKFGDIPEDIMQMIPTWINEVLGGPRLTILSIPALREGNQELPQIEDFRPPKLLK